MEYLKVYADENLRAALHSAAQARGLSDSELARRLIGRGLAIDGSDAQAIILAEAVRAVVRDELRPTRRLAYLAAFESAAAHRASEDVSGVLLFRIAGLDRGQAEEIVTTQKGQWARFAAERVRDPEPADSEDDAPADELPQAGDEVDGDTAILQSGQ